MSQEKIMPNPNPVSFIIDMAKQTKPDWDKIDQSIISLKDYNSNEVADNLFILADPSSASIMDAVASSFNAINLSEEGRVNKAIDLLSPVCLSIDDEFTYASGRSALFLNKFKKRGEVASILDQFRLNVEKLNKREELIENIPNIEFIL